MRYILFLLTLIGINNIHIIFIICMVSVRGLHDQLGLERERTTCIDIPEVNPEDVFLISVLLEDGLKALLETIDRGLACAEDGEARKLATELSENVLLLIVFLKELTQPS